VDLKGVIDDSFLTLNSSRLKAFGGLKTALLLKCYKSKCEYGMEILIVQSCSVHVVDDVDQIWSHLTEDYNVLVLKKDAEIFLKTQYEVKFNF